MEDTKNLNSPTPAAAPAADPRRPYEKPAATFVELRPEERLMACGKFPIQCERPTRS